MLERRKAWKESWNVLKRTYHLRWRTSWIIWWHTKTAWNSLIVKSWNNWTDDSNAITRSKLSLNTIDVCVSRSWNWSGRWEQWKTSPYARAWSRNDRISNEKAKSSLIRDNEWSRDVNNRYSSWTKFNRNLSNTSWKQGDAERANWIIRRGNTWKDSRTS